MKRKTAIAIYHFEWKGKWVEEKQPGHYFWMRQHHTNNLSKYLLHRALQNVLCWVCQRLNGFYRDPETRGWNTEICIRNKWRDPCGLFSDLFWKREYNKYGKSRQRANCSVCGLEIVKEEHDAFGEQCWRCWKSKKRNKQRNRFRCNL